MPTVRFIPGTTREANIATAAALAAVGVEPQIGWVDIGATYFPNAIHTTTDGIPGDALFAELFG